MKDADNTLGSGGKSDNAKPIVLVVDDQAFIRKIFRDALEAIGCQVEEACSGSEAIGLFRRQQPDLVILDLVMSGMDGFSACAALRSMEEGRHTRLTSVSWARRCV